MCRSAVGTSRPEAHAAASSDTVGATHARGRAHRAALYASPRSDHVTRRLRLAACPSRRRHRTPGANGSEPFAACRPRFAPNSVTTSTTISDSSTCSGCRPCAIGSRIARTGLPNVRLHGDPHIEQYHLHGRQPRARRLRRFDAGTLRARRARASLPPSTSRSTSAAGTAAATRPRTRSSRDTVRV